MKNYFLVFILCAFCVLSGHSQVAINVGTSAVEPNANAILDLQSTNKGFLLPRVQLTGTDKTAPLTAHVAGMKVYNTATVNSGSTSVSPGLYYNDGTRWIPLVPQNSIFFYAPSIVVPTETTAPEYNATTQTFTLNLYAIYSQQFGLGDKTSSTKNPAAGNLPVLTNNQLDYFVTYYDNTVFTSVAVSDAGVLTYKLKAGYTITEKTFMNTIFKIK
jgi:hypothetical protein